MSEAFTQEDKQLLERLLKRPMNLPPTFKSWLYKYAVQDAAPHFQEILGRRQRRWRIADPVDDFEFTSSTDFTDLATVGPELKTLENGVYMVVFGFYTKEGDANRRLARLEYNEQLVKPAPSFEVDVWQEGQAISFHQVELDTNDANSIRVRYAVDAESASFGIRWLYAVQATHE